MKDLIPELKTISKAMESLKDKGIIRTKNLVGDLGEYYCQKLFGIVLRPVVEKGYDALDLEGKKVEIKTRRIPPNRYKVIFKSLEFDYCLFVQLNQDYEPILILKFEKSEIEQNVDSFKTDYRLTVGKLKTLKHEKVYE